MEDKDLVKAWMNPGVISTTKDETIYSVARAMKDMRIGSLVVVDKEDIPIGIITSTDIITKVVAENLSPRHVLVDEIMAVNLFVGKAGERIVDAANRLVTKKIKKLPIIGDDGRLAGMLTMTDISRYCVYLGHIPEGRV